MAVWPYFECLVNLVLDTVYEQTLYPSMATGVQ